jgi:hypothetical protein
VSSYAAGHIGEEHTYHTYVEREELCYSFSEKETSFREKYKQLVNTLEENGQENS